MPGGDGTGPMGAGPMTGRAAGFCAGYGMPGYANPYGRGFRGRGFGRGGGRGGGRGWRHWFYATGLPRWARGPAYSPATAYTAEQELADLKAESEALQQEMGEINNRIAELQQQKNK
jgi:hypothetical protein